VPKYKKINESNKYWAFIPIWPIWVWVFYQIEKLKKGSLIILSVAGINIGIQMVLPFPYGFGFALVATPWFPYYYIKKWTQEWNQQFILRKNSPSEILSKSYQVSQSTFTSTIDIEMRHSSGSFNSTWRTGGLHDISDSDNYGNYYFSLNQNPVNPEISKIFENSLPLEGFSKSEKGSEIRYDISGKRATDEEARMLFNKVIQFFENKIRASGFTIQISFSD